MYVAHFKIEKEEPKRILFTVSKEEPKKIKFSVSPKEPIRFKIDKNFKLNVES